MQQIRSSGGTRAIDSKTVMQDLVRQTLQAFLDNGHFIGWTFEQGRAATQHLLAEQRYPSPRV